MRLKHKQALDAFLSSKSYNFESVKHIKASAHSALEAAARADTPKARNDLKKEVLRKKRLLIETFNAKKKALA